MAAYKVTTPRTPITARYNFLLQPSAYLEAQDLFAVRSSRGLTFQDNIKLKTALSLFLYHTTLALEREKWRKKPYFASPAETRKEKVVGQEVRIVLNRSRLSIETLVAEGGDTLTGLCNSMLVTESISTPQS